MLNFGFSPEKLADSLAMVGMHLMDDNALLSYLQEVDAAGYLECYDNYLLRHGNPQEFEIFMDSETEKFEQFLTWYRDNPINLKDIEFARLDY